MGGGIEESVPIQSKDCGRRVSHPAAANVRPFNRRRRKSYWQPTLSIVLENGMVVAEDHDNNVKKKQRKKLSLAWASHR
ncbi:hypothetical protein RIF29_27344 [Crotalaria pallida]|uniref:Uncharacterized protein n=1 Tax=Crotalaria pallida TaxID=3830 RepID=A0AAN9I5H3_CROPI